MRYRSPLAATLISLVFVLSSCSQQTREVSNVTPPTPTPTPEVAAITLSALDALLSDQSFVLELKAKTRLTDKQIANLKKLSSDEVARIQASNLGKQAPNAEDPRGRAVRSIRDQLGNEKADEVLALAFQRWYNGQDPRKNDATLLNGPNAVPSDTRIVVNIPAFRMDIFRDGALFKSYKIGIGYQQFPLPTGFRKAEMIIFNPTWTQPNESWASNPGAVTPAGAAGNPLGPIKVPIGGANLIHGGKDPWKIGTFASHGCVGLTNDGIKDFARTFADATNTELKEDTMLAFLKTRTRTQIVKLSMTVPVELRYETIVLQEGQLYVYRDVYNRNTNTEENLRAVFSANGVSFDSLPDEEKTKALDAVNAMSLHPKKQLMPKPTMPTEQASTDKHVMVAERKAEIARQDRLRNQKEIVIDIPSLSGKGYPGPKDLYTPSGKLDLEANTTPKPKRPRANPSPEVQSSPGVTPIPAPQSSPRTNSTPVPLSSPRRNPTPAPQPTQVVQPPRSTASPQ